MCPLSIISYICKPLTTKFGVFIRELDIVCNSDWYPYGKDHYDIIISAYDHNQSDDYIYQQKSLSLSYEKSIMTSILERANVAQFESI